MIGFGRSRTTESADVFSRLCLLFFLPGVLPLPVGQCRVGDLMPLFRGEVDDATISDGGAATAKQRPAQ